MASRLMSLIRMLPLGSAAGAHGGLHPNSWAMVSIWRRFFQLQEEEQEEAIQIIAEAMEESASVENARPIASEEASNARNEFVREYYRVLTTASTSSPTASNGGRTASNSQGSTETTPAMQLQEVQQLYNPNLDIPTQDGQSYVTLAQ